MLPTFHWSQWKWKGKFSASLDTIFHTVYSVYSSLADVEGPLSSIVMPDRQPGEEAQNNLIENNPILTFAKSTAFKVLPLYNV